MGVISPIQALAAALSRSFLGKHAAVKPAQKQPMSSHNPNAPVTSPSWLFGVPPTKFKAKVHPRVEEVIEDVHGFFLRNWPFPSEKAKQKFVLSDLTGAMSLCWPDAIGNRIFLACKLFTILFLIDDILEDLSFEEGREYNERVLALMHGDAEPDRSIPIEWITYDLWVEVRACDPFLAGEVLKDMKVFMEAQTDPIRLKENLSLDEYLEWRILDVGGPLISTVGCFCMGLVVPPADRALLTNLDRNWGKHVIFLNDAWSYDKELRKSMESGAAQGALLCSATAIVMRETGLPADATKRILIHLMRECEWQHNALKDEVLAKRDTPEIRKFIKGLEYQMSGNEVWTRSTVRYQVKAPQQ